MARVHVEVYGDQEKGKSLVPSAGTVSQDVHSNGFSSNGQSISGWSLLARFQDDSYEQAYQKWWEEKLSINLGETSTEKMGCWSILFGIYALDALLILSMFVDLKQIPLELAAIFQAVFFLVLMVAVDYGYIGGRFWNLAVALGFFLSTIAFGYASYGHDHVHDEHGQVNETASHESSGFSNDEYLAAIFWLLAVLGSGTLVTAVKSSMAVALGLLSGQFFCVVVAFAASRHSEKGPSPFFLAMFAAILANIAFSRRKTEVLKRAKFFLHDLSRQRSVTKSKHTINCKDLNLGCVIGQGQFGAVVRGEYRGESVAVKIFNTEQSVDKTSDNVKTSSAREIMARELEIMSMLWHPNISCFYGSSWELGPGQSCIVSAFAPLGTMQDVLGNSEYCREHVREQLLHGVCKGMRYMHNFYDKVIIHHDLKPSNILVDCNLEPKITDFGVSLSVERDLDGHSVKVLAKEGQVLGSPLWLAPEVHLGQEYNETLDVFSYSLILCEAMVGDGMYVVKSYNSCKLPLDKLAKQGFRPPVPESVRSARPDIVKLMEQCWDQDMDKRPSFAEIDKALDRWKVKMDAAELPESLFVDVNNNSLGDDSERHKEEKKIAILGAELRHKRGSSIAVEHEQQGQKQNHVSKLDTPTASSTSSSCTPLAGDVAQQQQQQQQQQQPRPSVFSGRAFELFTPKGQMKESPEFLQTLCDELQQELKSQAESYEQELVKQKEEYESRLESLAAAVL